MKRVIISEAQAKIIVKEMISSNNMGGINEISAQDAYNKFYSEKISSEKYKELMAGAPTMTPLHKIALDFFTEGMWDDELAQNIAKLWTSGNENAKKYVLDLLPKTPEEKHGIGLYYIKNLVRKALEAKNHTEEGFSQNGYHILKDGINYLFTCTTSYSASKKHFGMSHWCTASDVGGRYNGFKMFGQYTGADDEDGCSDGYAILVQMVNKNDTVDSLQIQLYDDGCFGDICKFDGSRANDEYEAAMRSEGYEPSDLIQVIGGSEMLNKLINQTQDSYNEEYYYWEKRYNDFIIKRRQKIMANNGAEYEDSIINALKKLSGREVVNYNATGENSHPAFEINEVEIRRNSKIRVFNILFKGANTEDKEWLWDAYSNEDYRILNGFNNQAWMVSELNENSVNVIAKVKGWVDWVNGVTGELKCETDYYSVWDEHGSSLIDIRNGRVLVKNFNPIRLIDRHCDTITGKTMEGHDIIYFECPANITAPDGEKGYFYVDGIDSVDGKYLGHIGIPKDRYEKKQIYGWMKMLDYDVVKRAREQADK